MTISKFPKSPDFSLLEGEEIDVSGEVPSGESDRHLFESGAIDRQEFIAREVERALAHLEGAVSSEHLDTMKRLLATEMEESPVFSDLIDKIALRAS